MDGFPNFVRGRIFMLHIAVPTLRYNVHRVVNQQREVITFSLKCTLLSRDQFSSKICKD